MRKVLLVIGLIGASFAGGAVVNGPGLDLLRSVLKNDTTGEPGPVLPMAGAGVVGAATTTSDPSSNPFPSAPQPGLAENDEDDDEAPPEAVPPRSLATIADDDPVVGSGVLPLEPLPTPSPTDDPDASAPEARTEPDALAERSEDAGPDAPPAPTDVLAPPTPGEHEAGTLPTFEPTPPLADATPDATAVLGTDDGDPATPKAPSRAPKDDPEVTRTSQTAKEPAAGSGPAETPTTGGDWSALRDRLADAGVARYWIEGAPDDRARFRCVIPLAGETAVGQQFEAEGDTEFEAAELVLRRIALWRIARDAGSP